MLRAKSARPSTSKPISASTPPISEGSRLYEMALGGGGILDVGGYPASLARLIAGTAINAPFDNPVSVKGTGTLAPNWR